jgi:uncharacterized protein (DUF1697 family)
MTRWALLLRAVNVGGRRRVPMADLRALLEAAGFTGVRTLVNSGNAVVSAATVESHLLEGRVEALLAARFGFDVPVIARTSTELGSVIGANPFPDTTDQLHVAFYRHPVDLTIEPDACDPERFVTTPSHTYLLLPNGVGKARLPKALQLDRPPVTVRNWRTVTKLAQLMSS